MLVHFGLCPSCSETTLWFSHDVAQVFCYRAEIDENDSNHGPYAEQLLAQLLSEMEKKSNEMDDFLTKLKFHEIIKQLSVSFFVVVFSQTSHYYHLL